MKKIIAFFAITALLIMMSPLVAADNEIPISWSFLSQEEQYYTAREGAQQKGLNWSISYDDYLNNKNGCRDFIRENGYVFTWNDSMYNAWSNSNINSNGFLDTTYSTNYDYIVSHGIINDGSANFNSYNNAVNNAVSNGKKEDFYNGGAIGSADSSFDLGNGYVLSVKSSESVNPGIGFYDVNVYGVYSFNGSNETNIPNGSIYASGGGYPQHSIVVDRTWISKENNRYYLNATGSYTYEYNGIQHPTFQGRIDITNYVEYIPNGMTDSDIKPEILNPLNPLPQFEPVDGSDQTAVNEGLQEQINDTNNWLEKIYNEEVSIHSTLKSFLSPLSGLLGCGRNIESICNSILSKLDNLTVRIKNSDGTDIDFGDLELGDINIDFDVVYNVTGITKITTPNDLTKNFGSYKETLESKLGTANARQTANNFSNALFGTNIFNQNGSINSSANPSFSATKPTLYVYYNNVGYDLYAYLNFSQENLQKFKDVVSFFLLLGTFLAVFRYIPSLIGNITGLEVRHEMIEHAEMQNDYINEWNAYHDTPFNSKSPNPFKGRWI